ncbi:MAG TPA: SDR family NAD(P)-dependent oxidoreductase, partial [Thermomicrobiaceae bacterium]|nr:SDR family NAD(P)-dependent oxidoreductase [Thermomicrobiaceae bacterium]
NVAGIIQVAPEETLSDADYEAAMKVMFWGPFHLTRAVLPSMRRRRHGRVATVTSIGGKVSVPHLLPYSAAKFAAAGFSEGLRAELADDGISVTTILPGLMRTGSYVNALFSGQQKYEAAWFSIASSVPLLTMDAERAAAQVVQAARRGEAERVLGLPFSLVSRLKGLAPGLTADIFGLVDSYVLPKAGGAGPALVRGETALERLDSPVVHFLTTLGRRAGQHSRQLPGPDIPPGADEARQPVEATPEP